MQRHPTATVALNAAGSAFRAKCQADRELAMLQKLPKIRGVPTLDVHADTQLVHTRGRRGARKPCVLVHQAGLFVGAWSP